MESLSSNPELRKLAEDAASAANIDSEEAFELVLESAQRIPRLANLAFLGALTLVFEADKLGLVGEERKQWTLDQVLGETVEQTK